MHKIWRFYINNFNQAQRTAIFKAFYGYMVSWFCSIFVQHVAFSDLKFKNQTLNVRLILICILFGFLESNLSIQEEKLRLVRP